MLTILADAASERTGWDLALGLAPTLVAIIALYYGARNATRHTDAAFKQMTASTVIANRSQWVETLHADIARFIALQARLTASSRYGLHTGLDSATQVVWELTEANNRISLLLDPSRDEHGRLKAAMSAFLDVMGKAMKSENWPEDTATTVDSLRDAARATIAAERDRIAEGV